MDAGGAFRVTSSISGTGTNDRPKDDPVLNLENKTVTFDEGDIVIDVKSRGTYIYVK